MMPGSVHMPGSIHGGTQVLGVIGRPIAHSLSPLIHNLWFDQQSIPAIYVAFPGEAVEITDPALFSGLFQAGIRGLNVTAPYKDAAFAACLATGPLEQELRATNVLVRGETGWIGHNTDAEGFLRALREERRKHGLGDSLSGARIVVLGAGGAARACVVALAREGARLAVVNRDPARAHSMRDRYGTETCAFSGLERVLEGADLVINCLPVAADEIFREFPWAATAPSAMAADLAYSSPESGFLASARRAGRPGFDGLGMLLHQAALSFELWWKISPDIESARKAAREFLERRA